MRLSSEFPVFLPHGINSHIEVLEIISIYNYAGKNHNAYMCTTKLNYK